MDGHHVTGVLPNVFSQDGRSTWGSQPQWLQHHKRKREEEEEEEDYDNDEEGKDAEELLNKLKNLIC